MDETNTCPAPVDAETQAKRDLARKAAEYIKEHGWHQCDYGEPGGPVCLLGALNVVEMGRADPYNGEGPLTSAVGRELASHVLGRVSGLAGWNDRPGRTQQDVTGLLLKYARGDI
jgi:hypothetical protein